MANPHKQELSRGLADMKFMKRNSTADFDFDSGGPLTDRWLAKNVPQSSSNAKSQFVVSNSYVEFEDLNQFGRYSYSSYNKEIERMMTAYMKKWKGQTGRQDDDSQEEDETEVSIKVSEMAKRYQDLGGGARQKRKRKH